jgi:hypothetical protein
MPDALRSVGIDPDPLAPTPNAAAIQFELSESSAFEQFLAALLTNLTVSDFTLAFPTQALLCTIHHHQQLWWMSGEPGLIDVAERLARENAA